jgi:LysR family hydrogen peroxide-inducible transcriptional activator
MPHNLATNAIEIQWIIFSFLIDINYHTAMTLQELRYIVAVAEHGHFGRAAEACHVAQPSLSAAVKKLEDEFGLQIFERGRGGVLVTREGVEIVAQARRILDEVSRLRTLAGRRRDPLEGVFGLGTIPTIGPYLLPHVVPGLRDAHPELQLHLREEPTATLIAALREGRIDAALLSPPLDEQGLAHADLYREDFLAALPRDHRLAAAQRVRVADLAAGELLLLDEGHCLRDQVLEVCRLAAETPARELLRGSSLETLRSMVAAGAGCTLLPALAERPADAELGLVVRPFVRPVPSRVIALYWRDGSPRETSARLLAAGIRKLLPPAVRRLRR